MEQAGANIHDLEREIVVKMGDATLPQVKVACGALLNMGRYTLASLREYAIDKERLVGMMEKGAAAANLAPFEAGSWASTLQDFAGIKYEGGAVTVETPLADLTQKASLCAPAPNS